MKKFECMHCYAPFAVSSREEKMIKAGHAFYPICQECINTPVAIEERTNQKATPKTN